MYFPPSPIELFEFKGRSFFLKRDDVTHPDLSGNKYRKLQTLLDTPHTMYTKIISYGGTQSNAMLALAAVASLKKWQFDYYYKKSASEVVYEVQNSNFQRAIELGMNTKALSAEEYETLANTTLSDTSDKTLFIPQGGASDMARHGISLLAQEIRSFQMENDIKNLILVTPSGTGTTAFYLATQMPENHVLTTAGIGNNAYLVKQMSQLGKVPDNLELIPSEKKYHFAKPHKDLLGMYHKLLKAGVEFDLLYAPKMWLALLSYLQGDETVMYIHSGGVSGNSSMLERYARKGWC